MAVHGVHEVLTGDSNGDKCESLSELGERHMGVCRVLYFFVYVEIFIIKSFKNDTHTMQ